MKVIWEDADILPGRRVGRPTRTERWLIGYAAGSTDADGNRWMLISLCDGMVTPGRTKAELIARLHESNELPEELLAPEQRRPRDPAARSGP